MRPPPARALRFRLAAEPALPVALLDPCPLVTEARPTSDRTLSPAASEFAELATSAKAAKMKRKIARWTIGMFSTFSEWIERRRELRRLCRDEARQLVERDPVNAYYDAQRAAARARFSGDGQAFLHWARVAAEVARISQAPMNFETVQAIVDEEERRALQ